ncbi:MAG: hypothetical protein FWE98_07140 [Oscillospiraceae bacterium]|nr:hypothetical protein [Oscillospiraceae bacterium]
MRYFVGKECAITMAGANTQRLAGVVTAVDGSWMTVQVKGDVLMFNTDFIVYIGEKKEKKKQ